MSGALDHIYHHSPIWLQQAMTAVYGWWWYRRRYNPYFYQIKVMLSEHETYRQDQFDAYQDAALSQLGRVAVKAPFYREIFRAAGLNGADLSLASLSRLPFLDKETLRSAPKDLLVTGKLPRKTVVFKSSGTTGTPTEIYYTPQFHAWELAAPAARNLGWAGIDPFARRVMFGVRKVCRYDQAHPPFWRFSPAEDMAYASIYHLSPKFMPAYLQFLRDYRPQVIMGYPSALAALARYALEHDDLPAPAKGIFTTSETVSDSVRASLEAAWGCKVYDRYGAVEGCLFASQCEYGRYHVSPEVGVIEILDRFGQPCLPGQIGEVVCTGLQNTLQPLIRYRIGDAARWAVDQSCPCGREMPILECIEGRYEDICVTRDGREIARFDTIFKGVDSIREAQVVQERVDRFLIRVVPEAGFDSSAVNKIKENLRLHVGLVETIVQPVEKIARSNSGKFRAVICLLTDLEKRDLLCRENKYQP